MEVLYATDGSRSAEAALSLFEKIARRDDVRVNVVSVTSFDLVIPERPLVIATRDRRRARGDEVVEETVERLTSAGFDARGSAVNGSPSDRILTIADELDVDLILMGAGHRTWMASTFLGSTSRYVLHQTDTSVLIAHDPPGSDERSPVLVTVDGSIEARAGLEMLARVADPKRCVVDVASVAIAETPIVAPLPVPIPPVLPADHREIEQQRMERARSFVTSAGLRLRTLGFEVRSEEAYLGSPTQTLDELAQKGGYDLVVTGSRGLGALRRMVGGSVSDPVSRHSKAALVGRASARDRARA